MASCAGVISGNAIWSCPMHSNALVSWRGSLKRIACGQASERHRVPSDSRQRDWRMPQVALSMPPPNRRLQLTPLRGPEIVAILRADFGSTVIPT